MEKPIADYLRFHYPVKVRETTGANGTHYYRTSAPTLPGITTTGDSQEIAMLTLRGTKPAWWDYCLIHGTVTPAQKR